MVANGVSAIGAGLTGAEEAPVLIAMSAMSRWDHEVHSPNGHFWSLPVLLRAAARGKPSGCDDELNTDNEQELLQRAKEINTDNEQDLMQSERQASTASKQRCGKSWQNLTPQESLGELVDFAEALCRDPIVGRSHDCLGSVLPSRASEPSEESEESLESEETEGTQSASQNASPVRSSHGAEVPCLSDGPGDAEEVSPSDGWVADESEQVAFSNSVGCSEIPVASPAEEENTGNRPNSEVHVCLEACLEC